MEIMLNKILAIFFSFILVVQPIFSEPLAQEEGQTSFVATGWEPAPFKSVIGELELDVFYLMAGVPAPLPGVLVDKDDYNKLEFISNQQEKWCQERIDKERVLCDKKLLECQDRCEELNKDLIAKIDRLKVDIERLEEKNDSTETKLLWWKTGGISVAAVLSGLLIFKTLK